MPQDIVLSPTQLAAHLACPHLTQLERQRRAGELMIDFIPDPRLQAMQERGRQHEAAFVERLRGEGRSICDLHGTRDPAATLEAMKEGHGAIVQAPLQNDSFYGIADVLLRVDTTSALGSYSYEPLDTKLARETKAGAILQLCTYCELLSTMQQLDPAQFHIVTPLCDEHYRASDFAAYYRFVRTRFQTAASAVPRPATYPNPVSHCDVCSYWKFCDDHRRRDDHPSLIANIRTLHVHEFQQQGIATLAAVAGCDGKLAVKPNRGSTDTYLRLGHQARLQLRARDTELPPVDSLPIEAGRGLTRLPEPSRGDVFLDFEGDPFVGEYGLEYLTGFFVRDSHDQIIFEQYWAFNPAQERAACESFIDFVMARLGDHPGLHIYHFGAYEPSALKRLCARYDTRGEHLDRLLRGGRFIDLHTVVREALRIGVERYGLKELEPLHGFSRRLDLRKASIARRDLELALEFWEGGSVSAQILEEVVLYNGDDCLSAESLQNWLEQQRTNAIGQGQIIGRPTIPGTEPSEQVGERDQRIEGLRQALTRDLPDEPEQRSDEQNGRALLASMLSYFRQEEKNAWWEHFRLRELPPDDQLDEREMMAGLRFMEVLPKQGKERNARCRFSFPPQDTAIGAGDKVYFTKFEDPAPDDKATMVNVADLDLSDGTVVFSMGKAAESRHPSVVFREQVVGAKPLEKALLDFAESVRDHGFTSTGRFASASALLLRRKPRSSGTGGPLRNRDEPLLDASQRLCSALEHEVLPIQGPPGSGKTFTGARAIVALAKAGKRVGITAVSHKVIDNLLVAIRDAAAADGDASPLRLVHKHNEDQPRGIEYTDKAVQALAAIGERTVVGGTVWLWADDAAAERLDYLFIDEAGQMALAQALAAARAARNVVLLGDPQQLEQPKKGAHPDGADVAALVHILGKKRATIGDDQGLFLDSTYRLHPVVCAFTSELYYEGRLSPVAGLELQRLEAESPFAGAGLFLVEVLHEGNQAQSNEEVAAVAAIVQSFLHPGARWTERDGRTRALTPNDVLVVAPYNAQVAALQQRLAAFGVRRVGTVDKFQGQEAPVVIYSCTSSSPEDAPRGMTFLYDPHRFNVATSRAQGVVIVVANPRLFEPECRTPEQMQWANGLCRYRELARLIPSPANDAR